MRHLLFLLFGLCFAVARAEDSVSVAHDAYADLPPESQARANIFISRNLYHAGPPFNKGPPSVASSTDRYFEKVRDIVNRAKFPQDWGIVALHGEFVRVTVVLGSKKYELVAPYTDDGLHQPYFNPNALQKRQFEALLERLRLTSKQSELLMGLRQ
jgi:hypothetical protein